MKKNDYYDLLEKAVQDYEGEHSHLILLAPSFYSSLGSLVHEPDISHSLRCQLLAAIGYFVVPNDLYPEDEFGPIGFIDDVLLAIEVLVRAQDELGVEYLNSLLQGDVDLQEILAMKDYKQAIIKYSELMLNVRKFVGIIE